MPKYTRCVSISGRKSQELYDQLAADIDRFLSKMSIGKVNVERKPDLKQLQIQSSMVKATLICEEGQIRVNADLSLFAAPFRSKIDEGIDKWIARTFKA